MRGLETAILYLCTLAGGGIIGWLAAGIGHVRREREHYHVGYDRGWSDRAKDVHRPDLGRQPEEQAPAQTRPVHIDHCSCDRRLAWSPMSTQIGSPGIWVHADAVDANDCTGCPETGFHDDGAGFWHRDWDVPRPGPGSNESGSADEALGPGHPLDGEIVPALDAGFWDPEVTNEQLHIHVPRPAYHPSAGPGHHWQAQLEAFDADRARYLADWQDIVAGWGPAWQEAA